jgi:hypothetical protein
MGLPLHFVVLTDLVFRPHQRAEVATGLERTFS